MSTPPTMLDLVDEYLVARRSLGYALRIEGAQLRNFARFADTTGHRGPLTLDLILRWVAIPSRRARRFPGRRLDCIRPFARTRAAIDPANEVPPRGLVGPPRRRPVHHIYTDTQLATLVAAARALGPSKPLRGATYATLFGLLAATGLRVSEARRLARADVDLEDAVLHVRATKFRKSRLVPLHPTATLALRSYALRRDRIAQPSPTAAFFVGARGMPLPYGTIRAVFLSLRRALGWEQLDPLPRIHDLRHAFACRRLRDWYAAGVDVAPLVASLATYLGHAHVTDTYWYLTGSPDLLAQAADRFAALVEPSTPREGAK
jgi:integrase